MAQRKEKKAGEQGAAKEHSASRKRTVAPPAGETTARRQVDSPAREQGAASGYSIRGLDIEPPQPIRPLAPLKAYASGTPGATGSALTVIYIHGIGNKPEASVLKCQWDTALFGIPMGDRTRLAYWVNREYYPAPEAGSCASADVLLSEPGTSQIKAASAASVTHELDDHVAALAEGNLDREILLSSIASKIMSKGVQEAATGGIRAKTFLPSFIGVPLAGLITKHFLKDVNDFLFNAAARAKMEKTLVERLQAGGGPFVVVSHSQGTMIAYNVLRQFQKSDCDVRLFVTLGSPLGISEVQDVLRSWSQPKGKKLPFPPCVDRWLNVADTKDIVALDPDITAEYEGNIENVDEEWINCDSPRHPHSGTGYLRIPAVRKQVFDVVGAGFAQPTGRAVIAKDLVADLENHPAELRHEILIELCSVNSKGEPFDLDQVRKNLVGGIEQTVKRNDGDPEAAQIDVMKRFVAARLTRLEVEQLRTAFVDLKIERVWKNASKRALINDSVKTVQALTGHIGYGALGEGIRWAVLDTGIRADHPQFLANENVERQWDCTRRGESPVEYSRGSTEFNQVDKNGHGTHVAGIIAGAFTISPASGKKETFSGMAPMCKLYGFKVLDDHGDGRDAYIIKALDQIAELNEKAGKLVIHGVNLSLGGNFDPSVYGVGHTPLCDELRRLWGQGVVVCLAAGNEGYVVLRSMDGDVSANMDLSIGDPANLEEAIAVGSVHKTNPHTYGISYFSSRGPTADGRRKPDLVAPGERILSAYHNFKPHATYGVDDLYIEMSGTSMAAPHVSGLLAAFLSARKEFIGYPNEVKRILLGNATDLARDPYMQGAGMPNLVKMLANT
jgi:subtilisin family serine protease